MNERIKELLKEATEVHDDRKTGMTYTTVDYNLFAEMIIKETLQVARAGVEFGPSMEDAVYNYFGVKE